MKSKLLRIPREPKLKEAGKSNEDKCLDGEQHARLINYVKSKNLRILTDNKSLRDQPDSRTVAALTTVEST